MRLFSRLVCSSGLTSSQCLIKMMPESIIAFSKAGAISRNDLVERAKAHHPFDAGAVVPATVEDVTSPAAGRCGT
jgi:hypothetical protein